MYKCLRKLIFFMVFLVAISSLFACGNRVESVAVDAGGVFAVLQSKVTFDTQLSDMGQRAEISYVGLPEGAKITMYAGNGYFADELTWIALPEETDIHTAEKVVKDHIAQLRDHFVSYQPSEVPKIDAARIWKNSTNIILCITSDAAAGDIMADPGKYVPVETVGGMETVLPETTAAEPVTEPLTQPPTQPLTEPPTETPTEVPTEAPDALEPPAIVSEGTLRKVGGVWIVDAMAYEPYRYNSTASENYARLISGVAASLEGQAAVYSMIVPTAVGVVFPDNLKEQYPGYEDQGQRIREIFTMMSDGVQKVDIFDKMMEHRDEYLYFRTDWHWNGIGAYYAYERFCEVKGITPYTMEQREGHAYEGYLGPLYTQNTKKDAALAETPDTVYAYEPYFKDTVSMVYTDTNGNRIAWPVIANGDTYGTNIKYMVFAAGDQPMAEFTNTSVTDGSVAVVVKESYGNAMMSYLVDHYSKVYEIDYRYWQGSVADFAREVGATDVIFVNNAVMVSSSYLVGLLANVIP